MNSTPVPKENDELIALYDYAGATKEELASMTKGDELKLLNGDDKEWWFVRRLSSGTEGYVPRSYVSQKSQPATQSTSDSPTKSAAAITDKLQKRYQANRLKVIVKTLPKLRILSSASKSPAKTAAATTSVGAVSSLATTAGTVSALSAAPSLFQQYTTADDGNSGRLSEAMAPQLEVDGYRYADFPSDATQSDAKCTLCFSILQAKNIPPAAAPGVIQQRWVTFGLWDRKQIIGNFQTVPAYIDQSNPRSWRFSAKSSLLFARNDENTCFLRCDQLSSDICLLLELGVSYSVPKDLAADDVPGRDRLREMSCGWAILPLYTPTLSPLAVDTYDMKIFSGSPLDSGPPVSINENTRTSRPSSPLKSLFGSSGSEQPAQLSLRVWKLTDDWMESLEKLPRNLCAMLSHAPLLTTVRELLFEALSVSGSFPATVGTFYSPSLSIFFRLVDRPLLLQRLADQWNHILKSLGRSERKSIDIIRQKFNEATTRLWPTLVIVEQANSEAGQRFRSLTDDQALLPRYTLDAGVKNFGENPQLFAYRPFDTREVYFNPQQPSIHG